MNLVSPSEINDAARRLMAKLNSRPSSLALRQRGQLARAKKPIKKRK